MLRGSTPRGRGKGRQRGFFHCSLAGRRRRGLSTEQVDDEFSRDGERLGVLALTMPSMGSTRMTTTGWWSQRILQSDGSREEVLGCPIATHPTAKANHINKGYDVCRGVDMSILEPSANSCAAYYCLGKAFHLFILCLRWNNKKIYRNDYSCYLIYKARITFPWSIFVGYFYSK